MIQAWASWGESGTTGIAEDARTLSLDVLAATGFQKSYKFRASTEPGPDEARNYGEALMLTLDNALFMMLVPPKLLTMPFVPKKIGLYRPSNERLQTVHDGHAVRGAALARRRQARYRKPHVITGKSLRSLRSTPTSAPKLSKSAGK